MTLTIKLRICLDTGGPGVRPGPVTAGDGVLTGHGVAGVSTPDQHRVPVSEAHPRGQQRVTQSDLELLSGLQCAAGLVRGSCRGS